MMNICLQQNIFVVVLNANVPDLFLYCRLSSEEDWDALASLWRTYSIVCVYIHSMVIKLWTTRSTFPGKVNNSFKYDTYQTKLPLGWWSCTMGFSKNWKALGIVLVVLFPYFTVTVRKSDGTLSVRYSPVLQVISLPKCSLSRQGHKSTLAGVLFFFFLEEGASTQGHCAVEAHRAAVWQLVKSWLCCFCSSLFFHYLCLNVTMVYFWQNTHGHNSKGKR